MLLVVLLGWLVCGGIAMVIASVRQSDELLAFLLGLFLGPVGIIITCFLPVRPTVPVSDDTVRRPLPVPVAAKKLEQSVADEIGKFADLRDRGALTEEEFNEQKRRLLG